MANKRKLFANIFIVVSIIFLTTMILVYGGRFIYYYKNSHIKEKVGETLLTDVINSLSYNGSIIKENDNIYYSGNIMSNYVYYSNRYYRIIGIENGKIILVDDSISTILPYDGEFKSSDLNKWLNKTEEENTGIYYKSLVDPDKYLTTTKTCLDNYDGENITCDNYIESDIGLLSINQYLKANVNGNYLNQSNYYWFVNKDSEEHNWYIDPTNEVKITNSNPLYGVRPVITLKENVLYYGGTGTMYEPYLITETDREKFYDTKTGSIGIGSYITLNDNKWKVIDANDDTYKVISVDSIGKKVFSEKTNKINLKDKDSLVYYLNNEYLETLDKKYLKEGTFNTGSFSESYLDKYEETENLYVGLLEIGDLYPNDLDNTYTLTNTGRKDTIFKIIDGRLYSDSYENENEVRPVIFIDKNIKLVDGNGTIDNPYEVGEA